MIIDAVVSAILDRLRQIIGASLAVEAFPDDPANYSLWHPAGAVLVAYGGSRFGQPEALDPVVQTREAEFDVTLLIRHLRPQGTPGANAHLDAIRLALTGLKPAGGRKLRPVRERLVDHDNGIWRFEATFAAEVPAIERDEAETAALLTELIFEGAGTTPITSEATQDE